MTILQVDPDLSMLQVIMMAPVASFIFAITIATSLWAFYNDTLYSNLILQPYAVARRHRVYTVLTSGMIHADYMHLFFNMLTYYFFAFALEPTIGHWQFGLLYVASLILSDIPTIYKHQNDEWYQCLGASGAVSAVIFSAIVYNPVGLMGIMFLPFPIYAVVFGVLYLVYCNYAAKQGRDNINHDAHLFGALSGVFMTIILHHDRLPLFFQQISAKVQSLLH